MLGPRSKGLAFTRPVRKVQTLSVDESLEIDGMIIKVIKATHGALVLKIGPFLKIEKPGHAERIDWGAMGFEILFKALKYHV